MGQPEQPRPSTPPEFIPGQGNPGAPVSPQEAPQPSITPPTIPGPAEVPQQPREVGGAKGPEPTRYGDWEHNGRCTDF